jgi:hypothetical protein
MRLKNAWEASQGILMHQGMAIKGGNYNLMGFCYLFQQKQRQKAIGKTHVDGYSYINYIA